MRHPNLNKEVLQRAADQRVLVRRLLAFAHSVWGLWPKLPVCERVPQPLGVPAAGPPVLAGRAAPAGLHQEPAAKRRRLHTKTVDPGWEVQPNPPEDQEHPAAGAHRWVRSPIGVAVCSACLQLMEAAPRDCPGYSALIHRMTQDDIISKGHSFSYFVRGPALL